MSNAKAIDSVQSTTQASYSMSTSESFKTEIDTSLLKERWNGLSGFYYSPFAVKYIIIICERHYLSKGPSNLGQLSHFFAKRRKQSEFRFKNKCEM